jgi:AraC-like DNA-binding protein
MEGNAEPDAACPPLFNRGLHMFYIRFVKNEDAGYRLQDCFVSSRTEDATWELPGEEIALVYFFTPFTLTALFNLPAVRLKKEAVDIAGIFPQAFYALQVQLALTEDIEGKQRVLDSFLDFLAGKHSRELEVIHTAIEMMLRDPSPPVLEKIKERLHITERTFQRMFKRSVGISAAQFRRICQFSESFDQLKEGGFKKLSDIALGHHFTDQSHFNRTFREFTGITPGQYLRSGLRK